MDRLQVLRKIAPEISQLVETRYTILRHIYFVQPIGRRALAARLKMPERTVRNEIDLLRDQGLVESDSSGMLVTAAGEKVLRDLKEYVRELRGLMTIEKRLAKRLGLETLIIVPGDSDGDETVKKEMAKATAKYLREVLKDGDVLAVTGGTTLAEVARSLPSSSEMRNLTVVPARGGMGEDVEKQANAVAASIARSLGATYRLLHIPDELSPEAINSIIADPKIGRLIQLVKNADLVLHGIGTAEEMARRRGMSEEQIRKLTQLGAVGEAFGYYFDRSGNTVYQTNSVGLGLADLENVGKVVAVGGGKSKAEAVLAVMWNHYQDVCITDEGCARQMLLLLEEERSKTAESNNLE